MPVEINSFIKVILLVGLHAPYIDYTTQIYIQYPQPYFSMNLEISSVRFLPFLENAYFLAISAYICQLAKPYTMPMLFNDVLRSYDFDQLVKFATHTSEKAFDETLLCQ